MEKGPRQHRIDCNAIRSPLQRQHAGHLPYSPFAGGIRRALWQGDDRKRGADVYDPTVPLRFQVTGRGSAEVPNSIDVCVHHSLKFFGLQLINRAADVDAGVVDQYVQAAEVCNHLLYDLGCLLVVADFAAVAAYFGSRLLRRNAILGVCRPRIIQATERSPLQSGLRGLDLYS